MICRIEQRPAWRTWLYRDPVYGAIEFRSLPPAIQHGIKVHGHDIRWWGEDIKDRFFQVAGI